MRHLLRVPSSYTVIWQQGGAHGPCAAVPLNLLGAKVQADYVDSGVWARRAMRKASEVVQSTAEVRGPEVLPGARLRGGQGAGGPLGDAARERVALLGRCA